PGRLRQWRHRRRADRLPPQTHTYTLGDTISRLTPALLPPGILGTTAGIGRRESGSSPSARSPTTPGRKNLAGRRVSTTASGNRRIRRSSAAPPPTARQGCGL